MDKKKSTITSKPGGAGQASVSSKDTNPRRRTNIKMVQNVLLIWLDNNINEKDADCQNTVTQLRRAVNTINTFTDGDQCIEFISSMENDKACMIISGSLGQHIVPRIHNMSQVDTIFIFCGNKKRHEQWAKEWPKIKGIFTQIKPICDALKQAAQVCEHNAIPISFMATSDDLSTKNLNQLDCSFMYTQIMKEILLSIQFEERHIQDFINYCHDAFADNKDELINVKELERKYRHKTPIWWYTCEGFLYPMLNRALRLMDVDIIIKMGFFIGDLHRHIERLHVDQFSEDHSNGSFIVYRGQGMSAADFQQLTKTKGGLMSFNSFLSTSKDRTVSLPFARNALANPDLAGILFVMTIDPSVSTTPFASISNVSYFQGEGEVLFSMHTVFRIRHIKPMDKNNRLFQVDLTLTSDNDADLCALTERIRKLGEGFTGWYRLGQLVLDMGQSAKAQEVFEMMLEQTTDDREKGNIYDRLGAANYSQGEYQEAIAFYEKSLEMKRKTLPSNHLSLAASYNNIGIVYRQMDEYPKALSYYEKDLEISQQALPPNHPDLAASYNNIGGVNYSMNEYSEALSYYEKGLTIYQQSLPPNHPSLAVSYNNIGNVYDSMGDYPKAVSSYEKALAIKQQSLPPNHPSLGASYNNIGTTYEKMGDYSKARSFLERAVDNGQHSLPPNHPTLVQRRKNLEDIKKKL